MKAPRSDAKHSVCVVQFQSCSRFAGKENASDGIRIDRFHLEHREIVDRSRILVKEKSMFIETKNGQFEYQGDTHFVVVLHDADTRKLPVVAAQNNAVNVDAIWTLPGLLEADLAQ